MTAETKLVTIEEKKMKDTEFIKAKLDIAINAANKPSESASSFTSRSGKKIIPTQQQTSESTSAQSSANSSKKE